MYKDTQKGIGYKSYSVIPLFISLCLFVLSEGNSIHIISLCRVLDNRISKLVRSLDNVLSNFNIITRGKMNIEFVTFEYLGSEYIRSKRAFTFV